MLKNIYCSIFSIANICIFAIESINQIMTKNSIYNGNLQILF